MCELKEAPTSSYVLVDRIGVSSEDFVELNSQLDSTMIILGVAFSSIGTCLAS